jgi:hypothetical protein
MGISINISNVRQRFLRTSLVFILILVVGNNFHLLDRMRRETKSIHVVPSKTKTTRDRPEIRTLHLIGERHSGTKWMFSHLQSCFGHKLKVRPGLSRWKHWFQYNRGYQEKRAFVVVQFRNALQWVEAMRQHPHHAPVHWDVPWQTFVTLPWTMNYTEHDIPKTTDYICQEKFAPHQVVPCLNQSLIAVTRHTSMRPTYELRVDGSGTPYASVVELRRDKILNYLSMSTFDGVLGFAAIQYEDMLLSGTASLVRQIEDATGTQAQCKPYPGKADKHDRLEKRKYVEWMRENVDWDVEALIGYKKPASPYKDLS